MLGLGSSLAKGGASLLTYVKDNLKLYLDFTSNKSDTLKFPCEGSTYFDGDNDYIDLGDDTSLDITSAITISCWIKPMEVGATSFLVGRDDGTNRNYYLTVNTDNNINWNCNGVSDTQVRSTTAFTSGTWYHIAGVYDGANMIIYVNGVAEDTDASTGSIDNDDVSFTIGAREAGADRFFKGYIANVGLWSRALSLEEINSIMRKNYSQLGSVEKTSLVSWWALDNTELGTNLVSNGDFSNGATGWTDIGTGWDLTGGNATSDNTQSGSSKIRQSVSLVQNKVYRVTYDWSYSSVGSVYFYLGSQSSGWHGTTGSNLTADILYTGSTGAVNFDIYTGADSNATIDNISLQEFYTPDSKGSNNGTVTGATTTTSVYGGNAPVLPRAVSSEYGEAEAIGDGSALFDGSSDYISLDNYSLSPSGTYTVSFWFKTGVDDNGAVYTNVDGTANYISIGMWDGHIQMNCADSGGTNRRTTGTYNDNEWHHATLIKKDTSTCSAIYIDGILVGQDTSNTWSGTNSRNEHVIGRAQYTSTEYYWGRGSGNSYLSQLGIWKGELTQAQIQSVMESTSYAKIPASVKSTLGANTLGTPTSSTSEVGWDASTEVLTFTENRFAFWDNGVTANSTLYKIQYEILTRTAGGLAEGGGSSAFSLGTLSDSVGSYTIYAVSRADATGVGNNNDYFQLQSTGFRGTIGNISIKEVTNDLVGYWGLDADNSEPSLYFDGSSNHYITVPNSTSLQVTTTFSLIAWARLDDFSNDSYANILQKGNDYMIQQDGTNDDLKFTIYDGSWNNAITTTSPLTEKKWFHTVATYDGSTMKVYADGVLQKELSVSSSAPQNVGDLTIAGSGSNHWKGEIASCAITNTTLSASEISTMYNNGISADISSTSGLVGYWKLNTTSTSSGAITDLSGSGNHGTLTGSPTLSSVALDSTTNKNIGALI